MASERIDPLFHSLADCRKHLLRALTAEMNFRPDHDDWIERERLAMTIAANEWAQAKGLPVRLTTDDVERVEQSAVGHYDYSTKFALYVSELIYGVREVRP